MTFEVTQRRSVIVHLKNVRQARQLRRWRGELYFRKNEVCCHLYERGRCRNKICVD